MPTPDTATCYFCDEEYPVTEMAQCEPDGEWVCEYCLAIGIERGDIVWEED